MHKLDLPLDTKEAASIERRRNREQQRQSRIFNAHVRTVGVDLQALEEQVEEKKWMTDQEKRRNEAFSSDILRNDKICTLLQERQEKDVRALNNSMNEFRQKFQSPEDRREFDIYDSNGKKNDKPARISDDDPRCGVSGMQKFLGENLNGDEIRKLQQEQLREWTKQQVSERNQELANLKQAQHLYDLKAIENDQRAMELSLSEEDSRKAINMDVKNYNLKLAQERKSKEDLEKQKELENNLTEISNQIFGDVLTENPSVSQSAFGSHRVITDRWKGMNASELGNIRQIQDQQIQEKKLLTATQSQHDSDWNKQTLNNARAAVLLERQMERQRKELMRKQADENLRLATEQKSRLEHINKEVYTNEPTAAFFTQFNTSSR